MLPKFCFGRHVEDTITGKGYQRCHSLSVTASIRKENCTCNLESCKSVVEFLSPSFVQPKTSHQYDTECGQLE